ncbi:hypothetical protein MTR_8g468260 [Medicago truncatula]|uniref:Transmembrane protein n=1 Tax=Medicago truncatula TaxID=3880 RepID=A0A072TSE2_MEDTR|nr:hypothetical protein MTR_8g468260 [Medicago truncatula]
MTTNFHPVTYQSPRTHEPPLQILFNTCKLPMRRATIPSRRAHPTTLHSTTSTTTTHSTTLYNIYNNNSLNNIYNNNNNSLNNIYNNNSHNIIYNSNNVVLFSTG